MSEIGYLPILTAALAAFAMSAIWNAVVFGDAIMKLHDPQWQPGPPSRPPTWKLASEFVRGLVVAIVMAHFVAELDVAGWMSGLQLGALVWLGFPAMILAGAVLWENVPWRLALIHVGDWLVKLLLIAVIVSAWP